VRAVLAAFLALSLGACAGDGLATATAPSAGNWTIERSVDRISGSPAARVYLVTSAKNNRGQSGRGLLQLMCYDATPVVRFAFDFKVGINKTAYLEFRFDANPGRKPNADILPDHTVIMIEEPAEVRKFVDELAASGILFVRVSSLTGMRTEAEFRTPGAPVAIDAAYADCPLRRSAASAREPIG